MNCAVCLNEQRPQASPAVATIVGWPVCAEHLALVIYDPRTDVGTWANL